MITFDQVQMVYRHMHGPSTKNLTIKLPTERIFLLSRSFYVIIFFHFSDQLCMAYFYEIDLFKMVEHVRWNVGFISCIPGRTMKKCPTKGKEWEIHNVSCMWTSFRRTRWRCSKNHNREVQAPLGLDQFDSLSRLLVHLGLRQCKSCTQS